MLSWILIPAYLLKNTLQRWLENVASPLTKVLVPLLFALLFLAVLGFIRSVEGQLRTELEREDLRTVTTLENVFSKDAVERLAKGLREEEVWGHFCERYESFQQVPVLASAGEYARVPVIAYDEVLHEVAVPDIEPGEVRGTFLLTNEKSPLVRVSVEVQGYHLLATVLPLPKVVDDFYQNPAVLMCPIEALEPAMLNGFTHVQRFLPKKDVSTKRLVDLLRVYSSAEGRRVRINSSVEVLAKLEEILQGQKIARLILGGGMVAILTLVLGSLALLEFRQELYLVALLRSFGVSRLLLGFHFLVENLFLTFAGVLAAWQIFEVFAERALAMAASQWGANGSLLRLEDSSVASSDLELLFLAAGAGVVLAALPIFWGLRKRPGLVLS